MMHQLKNVMHHSDPRNFLSVQLQAPEQCLAVASVLLLNVKDAASMASVAVRTCPERLPVVCSDKPSSYYVLLAHNGDM